MNSSSTKSRLFPGDAAEPSSQSCKRQKVDHPVSQTPVFELVSTTFSSPDVISGLIQTFTEKYPECSRTRLSEIPEKQVVMDQFLVVYIVISQGRQILMGTKRWRFVVREAYEDGTYGDQVFLTIGDYLPNSGLEKLLPEEFKTRTMYRDLESAPVLVLSGFSREKNKLCATKNNIFCQKENLPRMLLGLPKKHREPFFLLDFTLPQKPVPFASESIPTEFIQLKDMKAGQHSNTIGIITYSFHTPRSTRSNDFMFILSIVDPSLDISANDKVVVLIFAKEPEKLPQVRNIGDVILLKNFRYYRHGNQKQLKGNIGESSFVLISKEENWEDAVNKLSSKEKTYVNNLMEWYISTAKTVIAKHEPEAKEPWRPPNFVEFTDNLRNGVPMVSQNTQTELVGERSNSISGHTRENPTSGSQAFAAKNLQPEHVILEDTSPTSNAHKVDSCSAFEKNEIDIVRQPREGTVMQKSAESASRSATTPGKREYCQIV